MKHLRFDDGNECSRECRSQERGQIIVVEVLEYGWNSSGQRLCLARSTFIVAVLLLSMAVLYLIPKQKTA